MVATTSRTWQTMRSSRECDRLQAPCFRGVGGRCAGALRTSARVLIPANTIVRITSDCPLIDPNLVDETIRMFRERARGLREQRYPRTYPRGLDTEVFTFCRS